MRIYFFTGTGNSYWASEYLNKLATGDGFISGTYPIDRMGRSDIRAIEPGPLTGFIYPTHGFSPPWYMLKFIIMFPPGKGNVFLVNNRAGMKMGKLFTPGLSGIAVLLPMIILLAKGYRIIGTLPLDTPSNWITVHPGLRPVIVSSIFEKRKKDIDRLWSRISTGRYHFPLKFFILLPLDILVIQISIAYMLFGRFILARSYIPDNKCDGCGICAEHCPVGAIRMHGPNPYWTHRCESCMRCSNICPKKSINSSIPLMILYSWVIFRIAHYNGLFNFLWVRLSGIVEPLDDVLYWMILWMATLLLVYIQYVVIYFARRSLFFSRIIAFSTPMKYWRRYIAPGFRGKYKSAKSS